MDVDLPIPVQLKLAMFMSRFMLSVFSLGAMLIGIALVGYIIWKLRKTYPQLFLVNHSEPFEQYMQAYIVKVGELIAGIQSPAAPANARNQTYWKFLAMFEPEIKSPGGFLTRPNLALIRKSGYMGEQFRFGTLESNDDFENPKKIREFKGIYDELIKYKTSIRTAAEDIKRRYRNDFFTETQPCPAKKPAQEARMERRILELDLLLNDYWKSIRNMYDTRKVPGGLTLQFNIFRLYLWPLMKYFGTRIKEIWTVWEEPLDAMYRMLNNGWQALGNIIMNLPRTIVRKMTQRSDFENAPVMEKFAQLDMIKPDVIEEFGFLKGLLKIPKALAVLPIQIPKFVNVILMLPEIIMAVIFLITNPIKLIGLLIGLVFSFALIVAYMILDIFVQILLPVFTLWFVTVSKGVQTVVWLVIMAFMIVVYAVLWSLDLITGGIVTALLRCENLPNAWHRQPGFAFGNIYKRIFLCHYPCGFRYLPKGLLCHRLDPSQPSFCPQQILFEWITDPGANKNLKPWFFSDLKNDFRYALKLESNKKLALLNQLRRRAKFLKSCSKAYAGQHAMLKHFCHHVDTLFTSDGTDPKAHAKEQAKVKALCGQIFCSDYSSGDRKTTGCCQDFQDPPPDPEPSKLPIVQNTLSLMTVLFIVLIVFFVLLALPINVIDQRSKDIIARATKNLKALTGRIKLPKT